MNLAVIGGMGPLAGNYIYNKLLHQLSSSNKYLTDQTYPKTMLLNEGNIPSRVDAILKNGTSPTKAIVQKIRNLKNIGYSNILMACNTVHYFLDNIKKEVGTNVSIIDVPNVVSKYLKQNNIKEIMIIGTGATCKIGIYNKVLEKQNINVYYPNNSLQKIVDECIIQIKKHGINKKTLNHREKIHSNSDICNQKILIACTELSMLETKDALSFDTIDIVIKHIIEHIL